MKIGKRQNNSENNAESSFKYIELNHKAFVSDQIPLSWHPQYGLYLNWPILWLILIIVILGALAFVTQINLLFWAASVATAMLFVSVILPGRNIAYIDVDRFVPDTAIVGKPMMITYTVRNLRRYFPCYSLRLTDILDAENVADVPRAYVPYIPAGGACTFKISVVARKRGALKFRGIRIASKYPFGLIMRFNTLVKENIVTIYPALGQLSKSMLARSRDSDFFAGDTHNKVLGSSDEFYSIREYRQGDNPKLIHWRRSAGAGQLIVREMSQFSPVRITIIFDTYVPESKIGDTLAFERMVSFSATLLCQNLEAGYRSALVCSGEHPMVVPPVSHRDGQHRILRLLSEVSAQSRKTLRQSIVSMRFGSAWRGRCIIVSMNEQNSSVLERLAEDVGVVKLMLYGTSEWNRVFVCPDVLAGDG